MENINLGSLFYFWEIAKSGSLKQAALKLHLTQPALSHQLRNLESSLNTRLFDRIGKRLLLNQHGRIVQSYCDKIFDNVSELQNALSLEISGSLNKLEVGAIPSLSKSSVYKFLSPYFNDQTIRIRVKEDNLKYLLMELENGELDMIFTDYRLHNLSKSILQKTVFTRSFTAVCNPNCILEYKTFPKSLNGLSLINYTSDSVLHHKINSFLQKNKISMKMFTEIDDSSLIKEVVLNQPFAAVLSTNSVEREIKDKRLKRLGLIKEISSDLFILIHDDNSNPLLKQILAV